MMFIAGVVQVTLLVLGVASLLRVCPAVLTTLQGLGALYLLYLGARTIRASFRPHDPGVARSNRVSDRTALRANTKAAYRFFSNEKVSEDRILAGHFQASALRVQVVEGPILVLQDTTEFSFTWSAPEKIGFTKTSTGCKEKDGRFRQHTLCGLLSHASLAVTPDGLPLGLTAVKV